VPYLPSPSGITLPPSSVADLEYLPFRVFTACVGLVWSKVLLDPISLHCGHVFDKSCIETLVKTAGAHQGCPICRAELPATLPSVRVYIFPRKLRHGGHGFKVSN
jgi:hypothetical protein